MLRTESEQSDPNALTEKPKSKVSGGANRKEHSLAKKLQVVRETLTPGASVSIVARRHDINSNMVFRWRKMYERGELRPVRRKDKKAARNFVPVGVLEHGGLRALPAPEHDGALQGVIEHPPAEHGVIEIETGAGVKVRVSGRVDDRTLQLVLAEIRRLS
jgi:transposase